MGSEDDVSSLTVHGSVSVSASVWTVADVRDLVRLLNEMDVPDSRSVERDSDGAVSVSVLDTSRGDTVQVTPLQEVSGVVIRRPAARLATGTTYANPFSDLRESWGRPRAEP